jgi:hypothetical protein
MTLLEALKPRTFYETLTKVLRNFANRKFYQKQLKILLVDGSLKTNGMRLDKRYRAYYVLNLEPETLMMGEEVLDLEKSRVYESLSKKKPLFEKAGLGEIIEAQTERIKNADYYAYLIQIKYRPIATIWDVLYVMTWGAVAGFALYFLIRLGFNYQSIADWISNTMTSK